VAWGLDQARKEGISASVIVADGKEQFYQNRGFDRGPVGRGGEGGPENPAREVAGGLVFFMDKQGVIVKDRELGDWMYGPPGAFDWDSWIQKTQREVDATDADNKMWKHQEGSPWLWRDI
jgi:hypothetical protein